MLILKQRAEAKARLADIAYTGCYLDWLNQYRQEDFSPLLCMWRVLGLEEAQDLYTKAIDNIDLPNADNLSFLRHSIEFFRDAGWLKTAIYTSKAAVKEHEKLLGKNDPQTLISLNQYALAEKWVGNFPVAIAAAETSLSGLRIIWGKDNPELYTIISSLAAIHNAAGHFAEAEALFE